jgi:hypothetical protein
VGVARLFSPVAVILLLIARVADAPGSVELALRMQQELPSSSVAGNAAVPIAGGGDAGPSEAARSELRRMARAWARAGAEQPRASSAAPLRARTVDLARGAGLLVPVREPFELAGVTHVQLEVTKLGLPVFNRGVRRSARKGAAPSTVGAGMRSAGARGVPFLPPLDGPWSGISRAAAVERALRAVQVRLPEGLARAERGWFARDERTAPAWKVTIPVHDPPATWQVILDARSGEVLAALDRLLHLEGVGSVYVPNSRDAGGVPSQVPLFDLLDSGYLAGRITRVIDRRAVGAFRPDLDFRFPAPDPRFVQTSVYRALTDTGRFAEDLGFPAFGRSLHAFVNLAGEGGTGEYNNAFYDPVFALFGFGNGDGVVLANVATDSDVAAHEMGHHLFETLARPRVVFSSDPALAMHEGVADAIAALWNGDPEIAESVIPGQPYLRTLANARVYPDDVSEDPHQTGLIYGGLVWTLAQSLGTEAIGRILMAGLPFLPPQPRPHEFAEALLSGDDVLNAGASAAEIAAKAAARGLEDPLPVEFQGEIGESAPESRSLANDGFHFWVFYEFPGSTDVTFRTTGTGDVDLFVAPLSLSDDVNSYRESLNSGSSETVAFTASTVPSVNADDIYLVIVQDWPDDGVPSSYTLSVTSTLPPAQIGIPGTLSTALASADELDMFIVNGVAGQVVRVEVHAADPDLDLVAAVFDPKGTELLGANDDSGPGLDPLIQGARFPATEPYALAVFSTLDDFDAGAGAGAYTITLSLCTNTGTNTDGDLLADACDDDDDDDTFTDDIDSAPTDSALCIDVDDDGCDDCTNGAFDPFDDGSDFDGDAVCDAGDVDRDNDGCANPDDAAPVAPSVDPDLDFLGADCDNCPWFPNAAQADADADRRGDACECGDQNGDGRNTISDLVAINVAIFNPPLATELCDANNDGACNVADIVAANLELFSPGNTSTCARQPTPGP